MDEYISDGRRIKYFHKINLSSDFPSLLLPGGPDKRSKKSGEFARSVNINYSIRYSVYLLR